MKLLRIESTGDEIADLEEIAKRLEKLKNQWRKKHPNIVAMWGALSNAAWRATRHPGTVIKYKDKLEFLHDGESLWITLPSGRKLHYPECRIRKVFIPKDSGIIIETPKGKPALIFKDNASGQWRDVNIYGGLICENAVQAIARDLLARAMLRLDAAGFDIVAHVHDEAIVEVLIELAEKLKPKFHKLMTVLPSWAKGLPVVAKAWIAPRYVK
jgi:DNA polymerase